MSQEKIIVIHNKIWGAPFTYDEKDVPKGYSITTDRSMIDRAAAVVFHIPDLDFHLTPNRRLLNKKGQIWVALSMECEAHIPQLTDPSFMEKFDFTMTYHKGSDIRVLYLPQDFEDLIKRPIYEKKPENIACAFISSPYDKSGRLQLLIQLMERIKVHSFGRTLNTRSLLYDNGRSTKLDLLSTYKFTLAFENAVATDYVTEKFFDPLVVGSVPVYLGAPNVEDYAPGENCYIDASKWDDPEELADYLLELSENDQMYNKYFEWREKPLRKEFTDMLNETKEHEFVRLCKLIDGMI